jgi:hypothetical protein
MGHCEDGVRSGLAKDDNQHGQNKTEPAPKDVPGHHIVPPPAVHESLNIHIGKMRVKHAVRRVISW